MATKHTVRVGECMGSIAQRYGFHDYSVVYDHPDNAALKRARPNPNVLQPGDVVVIPALEERWEDAALDSSTTFELIEPRKQLRLVLHDRKGEPIAGEDYELHVPGAGPIAGQTDADGLVQQAVPLRASEAKLVVRGRTLELQLGALNPAQDTEDGGVAGVQARLHNLGYNVGADDGVLGRRTHAAIAMFQHERGMKIDGQISQELIDALRDEHGS